MVDGSGTDTISISNALLDSSFKLDNSLANSAGTNNVTFTDPGTLSSSIIEVSIGNPQPDATGTITMQGGFSLSATSLIELSTTRNIVVSNGSELLASGNGAITLEANQQATPTGGRWNEFCGSAGVTCQCHQMLEFPVCEFGLKNRVVLRHVRQNV